MSVKRIAALDIGGTKIASALVTLDDDTAYVESNHSIPTQAQEGGAKVLERAISSLERILELGKPIDAIGISTAGVVDPHTGSISYANDLMPGWMGIPLATHVFTSLGYGCHVLNDVHAHALGEARYGAGKEAQSMLVVAVGTGIGGAYVEHGSIQLGAHHEAGHIGHMCVPEAAGVRCSCGAIGHLEPIAAGPGIIAEYRHLSHLDDICDGAYVDKLAREGDVHACTAQARAGRALGEALGSACNLLDPELVVLSGSVAQCGPSWSEALKASFSCTAMPPVATTAIILGKLGGDAPLIGAAAHCIRSAYVL